VNRDPNPRRRSAASHSAILQAAYELCQSDGYGRLTIEAIAARAGVGKQTIYRWWPSRGALMIDVFLPTVMGRSVVAAIDDIGMDVRARVRALAEVLADPEIGPHIAGLIGDAQTNPDLARRLDDRFVQPLRAALRGRLLDGQSQGYFAPDIDLDVLADTLFGPIWFRLLVTRDPLTAAYAEAVVDSAVGRPDPAADVGTQAGLSSPRR
jgi:AcrR family transcriptional regulator